MEGVVEGPAVHALCPTGLSKSTPHLLHRMRNRLAAIAATWRALWTASIPARELFWVTEFAFEVAVSRSSPRQQGLQGHRYMICVKVLSRCAALTMDFGSLRLKPHRFVPL